MAFGSSNNTDKTAQKSIEHTMTTDPYGITGHLGYNPLPGVTKGVKWAGEKWDQVKQGAADSRDKAIKEAAEFAHAKTAQSQKNSGPDVNPLRYPMNLGESGDEAREMMRFNIVGRKQLENKQSIYLYTPPGVSVADSGTYTTQDFGLLGGSLKELGAQAKILNSQEGANQSMSDMIDSIQSAGGVAIKQKLNMKPVDLFLISKGEALNPHTNLQFEGVGMRSFTFAYKMVAQNPDESERIRLIENIFRKFLYPSREPNNLVLKYPPYWQIQFYKSQGNELSENIHLPFIDLCYLRNISVTYNSSTNVFHKGGAPVEVDMSLTFDEAQQNTREDLYHDSTDKGEGNVAFGEANYTYARKGLTPTDKDDILKGLTSADDAGPIPSSGGGGGLGLM